MHFVSTGNQFPYLYRIGILSAAKCGEVKLWYIEKPISGHFDQVIRKVPSQRIHASSFPALEKRSIHWNRVSLFDWAIWSIVSKFGGSVMGLDSITIRPFHDLLGDKELLVGKDAETVDDSYCMHGATAQPGSELAAKIHEDSVRTLKGEELKGKHLAYQNGKLRFGGAGIIPFLNNVHENMEKIAIAPFGVLGGYMHDGSPFYIYQKEGRLLNPDARTIPLYATWQREKFENAANGKLDGCLLGQLIKRMEL